MTFNDLLLIANANMCSISVHGSVGPTTDQMTYSVAITWCRSIGEVKAGGLLISECGYGHSLDEAARDYYQKIRGKTLVFHAYDNLRNEIVIQ